MTQEEFKTKLDALNIPVSYEHAKAGTRVPFVNYTWHKNPALVADNKVYVKKVQITVELVCNSKSMMNEYSDRLEDILETVGVWEAIESYSDVEQIYVNTYSLEV